VLELYLRNTSEIEKITVLGHFAKLGTDSGSGHFELFSLPGR
jgi:hypothetical protein